MLRHACINAARGARVLDLAAKFLQLEPGLGEKKLQSHRSSHGSRHREGGRLYYTEYILLCSVLYQRISSTGFGGTDDYRPSRDMGKYCTCEQMSGLKYVLINLAAYTRPYNACVHVLPGKSNMLSRLGQSQCIISLISRP